jgi:hypothetical protein
MAGAVGGVAAIEMRQDRYSGLLEAVAEEDAHQ